MAKSTLEDLLDFIRHPSISTDPSYNEAMRQCAEWLKTWFEGKKITAEIHQTAGHPVVLAETPKIAGAPTVLIYGHYDVQPVDPLELWDSHPFDPTVKDGIITARGATDNKGQIMAHMQGVAELLERGELALNVIFLIEGEEEIGSPNLTPFLEAQRDRLACDVVVVSDTGMVGPGVPTMTYGLRGVAALEVVFHGPSMDLHSGMYGGAVMNPATALARVLAKMHDDQLRVAIPGFYDEVKPLEAWEREAWAKLPVSEETYVKLSGAPALDGEAGYSAVERIAGRPTAEINGLTSGYQGVGTKTVLPSQARAKITFRLTPHQDPEKILLAAEQFFRDHASPAVTVVVERGHYAAAYYVDPHAGFAKEAQSALKSTWGREPALVREGGSIPIVQVFKDALGVETLLLGLALPDCRAHSPNETFPIENYEKGILLNQNLLQNITNATVSAG
ncbi:MAG: dipeptidase [Verrucomicrobiales bacterium]